MPKIAKRKLSENEESGCSSEFNDSSDEDFVPQSHSKSSKRQVKKPKYIDSEDEIATYKDNRTKKSVTKKFERGSSEINSSSEEESDAFSKWSRSSEKDVDIKDESSSSDDEPLATKKHKLSKNTKLRKKSIQDSPAEAEELLVEDNSNVASSVSDDEITKARISPKPAKNKEDDLDFKSDKEMERQGNSSDEDEPIVKKANLTSKKYASISSDDESLDVKSKKTASAPSKKQGDSSDEDEPIVKLANLTKKSKKYASISSDEKPLDVKSKKTTSAPSKKQGDSSVENVPILQKANLTKKSKKYASISSDDEPLDVKSKKTTSAPSKKQEDLLDENEPIVKKAEVSKSKKSASSSSNNEPPVKRKKITTNYLKKQQKSSLSDEPKVKMSKSKKFASFSRQSKKSVLSSDEENKSLNILENASKKISTQSSSSDDEPLVSFKKNATEEKNSKAGSNLKSHGYGESSDEEPLSKIAEASEKRQLSKVSIVLEDELSGIKRELSESRSSFEKSGSESKENRPGASSDEDPVKNSVKVKSKSALISSDDEPEAKKYSSKIKPQEGTKALKEKSNKISDVSSDEEDKPLSKMAPKKKDGLKQNSSNDRIEHLKKYIRAAGIRIQSYDMLFKDCKSIKAKVEKLLDVLHEKGMEGRPTLIKCKKLKKKLETKQEIAELDTANIIKTEGRPKRRGTHNVVKSIPYSPAKKFARLKDIIDSEESD